MSWWVFSYYFILSSTDSPRACHYLFLEFLRDDRKDLPSNVIAAEDVLLFTTTIRK